MLEKFFSYTRYRSSRPEVFCKEIVLKVFLEISQNLQENLFLNKVTLAQVLSCKIYEISKTKFSYTTPPVAASGGNALNITCVFRIKYSRNIPFEQKPYGNTF